MKLPFQNKNHTTPAEFWVWFQSAEARVLMVTATTPGPASKGAIERIGSEVKKMHPGLVWGMLGGPDRDTLRFEVSAGGIKEMIPVVREIVAAAPQMPGWEVVAFKQPIANPELFYGDVSVGRESVMCQFVHEDGGLIDLNLYLPLPADASANTLATFGFTMLDHTLGEEFVMTRLGRVRFYSTLVAPPSVMQLAEFAAKCLGQ